MKNKHSRILTAGISAIVYALTMFQAAFPTYVTAIDADDIRAFVEFENAYPGLDNYFSVWGEYTGTEDAEIQILSAVYDSTGRLMKTQLGEPELLYAEEQFVIEDAIFLDEDVDITDAVLKVFIWDSTGNIQPLGQAFKATDVSFTYMLDAPARTSAGVFDEDGNLIRTLWSGTEEDAGTYTKIWDGRDDNGVLQADGQYTVTVMENNVEIVADSFVGNTSDHSHYDHIIAGFSEFLSDMTYVDGKVFYIFPYSEGKQSIYYFNADNPDKKVAEFGGVGKCMQRAVTDGKRIYFMDSEHEKGNNALRRTFLYAFDLASQQMYMFEDNGKWMPNWGVDNIYYGVNELIHDQNLFQTGGLGVQTKGNMLFASYVTEGKVYVLDKNNGSLLNSQSFNTPRALAYNDNGGLWIGYKKADGRYIAQRYNVGANGGLTLDNSIALEHDFGYLLHLELSPDGKRIVAADGSTNQYKMYSTETGKLVWTFGSGESYEEDPTIYPDKLMLKYTGDETDLVYSEFENDNTLWVGDTGNNRAYKLDISKTNPVIIDEIMMQPGSHSLGVDVTDNTTIYSHAVQYKIDYQKSGNDAWRAVKNWKKQVDKYGIDVVTFNQFNNFITLPNGRTYFSAAYDGAQRLFYFAGNDLHYTGINFNDKLILDDGRIGSIKSEGGLAVYRLHQITGYNDAGDPIIDETGEVIARLSNDWTEPTHVFGGMKLNMPITENNIMLTLRCMQRTDINDQKTWHLGGVQLGDAVATDWKWKAAPEGSEFYDGNFRTDGTFEAGNGVLNSAQKVVANGKNVVFEYNGEGYRQGQTNKLYFYRDNGLLVGVFGEATRQRQTNENRAEYGKEIFPGNAFDMYFIQDADDSDRAYLLQNNENGFGNFKYNITGLDTIKEHTTEINLENALWDGLTYRYYAGDSKDPANLVSKAWRETIVREAYTAGDAFEMRYTGYIKNPNGGGKLKLSVNTKETMVLTIGGQEVFNGTGAATPEIQMEGGKLYPFSCVVKKNNQTSGNRTRVSLNYYDTNGRLQAFDAGDFKTDKIPYTAPDIWEVDLLEGLPFASEIKSGTYGIIRSPEGNVTGVSVNTNSTNASFDDVRDIRFQSSLWPEEGGFYPKAAWFTKNLGTPRENIKSWEIQMDVARIGYLNYGELGNPAASTGIHIDVLDVNDKVIARFYWAKENKTYGNNQFIYQARNLYNNNLTPNVYSVPEQYENDFNTPSTLRIRGENGRIIFEYYDGSVATPVLDADAQWDKPFKVKLDGFFNDVDQFQAREMNVSITQWKYTQYLAG